VTSTGAPAIPPLRALRRDPEHRILGGVCAGIARHLGIDPLIPRLAAIVAAGAGGFGVLLYLIAWAAIPSARADEGELSARPGLRKGTLELALGAGLLLLSLLLGLRALGIWFSDAVVWPLVLVAVGGALLWGQSLAPAAQEARPAPERTDGGRAAIISRNGFGVALVIAAGFVFLEATGSLSAARDVVLAAVVVAVVLALIFAPWIVRLARSLAAERAERIRSQERAEVAAHLHDSVLQTLALVQKRADDPIEVAALARRQERELRSWLSGRVHAGDERRLVPQLEAAAEEVERVHRVPVEVVAVGDPELDEPGQAVVAAAREAMVNAAKFAGGSPVDVYAEARDRRLQIFVRDRGPGFDPAAIPPDRRGLRESVIGRMERAGGRARISSAPGAGTEVELVLEGDGR
jgi:signal transduction histidine kinase/phage shock protein PspC (stress-responsive transcriptional regulator)